MEGAAHFGSVAFAVSLRHAGQACRHGDGSRQWLAILLHGVGWVGLVHQTRGGDAPRIMTTLLLLPCEVRVEMM